MKKHYSICKKTVCIDAPYFPQENKDWRPFECEARSADISVLCEIGCDVPSLESGKTESWARGGKLYRCTPMVFRPGALTEYLPGNTSQSKTVFTAESFDTLMDSRYMWSSVSLSQLMLPKGILFLHSSFIEVGGKAILFSAPCGTGKSTQAELWRVHRNATVINGDKAGLCFEESGISACGVPFSGTSGICLNRILPLGAVILLSQAESNSVHRLSASEIVDGVMRNIHIDSFAPGEYRYCAELLFELAVRVPVYSLACTPDEAAVEALEKELINGGVLNGA